MASQEESEKLKLQIKSALIELERQASILGIEGISKEERQSFIERCIEDGNTNAAIVSMEQKMMETVKGKEDTDREER